MLVALTFPLTLKLPFTFIVVPLLGSVILAPLELLITISPSFTLALNGVLLGIHQPPTYIGLLVSPYSNSIHTISLTEGTLIIPPKSQAIGLQGTHQLLV